jgi:hypothetical protein
VELVPQFGEMPRQESPDEAQLMKLYPESMVAVTVSWQVPV